MIWQPYDIAIFDCDSTLSSVEGIDELAVILDKKEEIAELTDAAMNGEIDLADIYGQRLDLLQPTKRQVLELRESYKSHTVPHAKELIQLLKSEAVEQWIVSGGLQEAVSEFGVWLGIDEDKIKAVGARYDPLSATWWSSDVEREIYMNFDSGELTETVGKGTVIEKSIKKKGKRLMLGDGMSDLAASSAVDLFVCYAGVVARDAVVEEAPVVIMSKSLAPAAALILGPACLLQLKDHMHNEVIETALEGVVDGSIRFNDEVTKNKFMGSYERAMKG